MRLTLPPAFRYPRFAVFCAGMALAEAGTQLFAWTILWHIRTLTDQPAALGTVGLMRLVPILLLSLFAGMAADRFKRRNVLIVTQSVLILVSACPLFFADGERLAALYALIAVQSTALSFDLPSKQSLVPNLVTEQHLTNAFSLQAISFQIGGLIGPALSGILIARWGLSTAYSASLALHIMMLVVLIVIGPVRQRTALPERQRANWSGLLSMQEGIRFTFRNPLILSSMLLDFFATLFTRADSLMPIIATDILKVGPFQYGWLASSRPIGSAIAGLILSFSHGIRRQGRVLIIAIVMIGAGTGVFGVSRSFSLTFMALVLIGAADAVSSIIRNTLRQLETPDEIRGRMTGVNQVFFMGGPQLGEWKSGLLGQWIGVPAAIILGGAASILMTGAIGQRWPQIWRYEKRYQET